MIRVNMERLQVNPYMFVLFFCFHFYRRFFAWTAHLECWSFKSWFFFVMSFSMGVVIHFSLPAVFWCQRSSKDPLPGKIWSKLDFRKISLHQKFTIHWKICFKQLRHKELNYLKSLLDSWIWNGLSLHLMGPKNSCAEMSQSFRSQKMVVLIVFTTLELV